MWKPILRRTFPLINPLQSKEFQMDYRTGEYDILEEFYIPCLQNSKLFLRGVGYFTSNCLSEEAIGLEFFISHGGKIQMVASPKLTNEDKEAIEKGYQLRSEREVIENIEEKINNSILMEIEKLSKDDRHGLEVISWLIAHERLEIKLAVRTNGIYHEKFGVFFEEDESSYKVGFIGSNNETAGGLVYNFERITVFQDKYEREKQRNAKLVNDFKRLWADETSGIRVFSFPDACKRMLIEEYAPKFPPIRRGLIENPRNGRIPRDYQLQAIESWKKNNLKGILALVTGAGKTFTAVTIVKEFIASQQLIIIGVPSTILLNQWKEEIESEFPDYMVLDCGEDNPTWQKDILKYLKYAKRNEAVFFIGTFNAFRSEKFQNSLKISNIKEEQILFIIDEVHKAGSKENSKIFNISAGGRIGLSATPVRKGDEEGNSNILSYLDKVVYSFTIKDAINHKPPVLTPYNYHIYPVSLSEEEAEDYRSYSKSIAQKVFSNKRLKGEEKERTLKELLIQRKNIIKEASKKLDVIREIVERHNPQKCLVYCNDANHVDQVYRVLRSLGKRVGKYTSTHLNNNQKKQTIDLFKQDDIQFLIAIKCLDEGVDIPSCQSAIILSSSSNEREYIQRRGRVLRLYQGKEIATIFDLVVLPFIPDGEESYISELDYKIVRYELERAYEFAKDAKNSADALLTINRLNRSVAELVRE